LDLVGESTRALGDALRERGAAEAVAAVIYPLVDELASHTNFKTCDLLGRPRGSHYRPNNAHRRAETGPRAD